MWVGPLQRLFDQQTRQSSKCRTILILKVESRSFVVSLSENLTYEFPQHRSLDVRRQCYPSFSIPEFESLEVISMSEAFEPDVSPTEGTLAERSNSPSRRSWMRPMILIRRLHLYAGLFLLPWVLLYGITGAMYNHQGLFPDVTTQHVGSAALAQTAMAEFPSPDQFAQLIVEELRKTSGIENIQLATNPRAEFTNDLTFEVFESGNRHVVHIDPIDQTSKVVSFPKKTEQLEPVLDGINNIRLDADPHELARTSVNAILDKAGIDAQTAKPFAWCKLNFLAEIDGEPARVTYVLKDGHVDVTKFRGEDGMTTRSLFMRLHTSHGRSPHWNGRSIWSLFIDTMAIAMVTWAVTGIFMWWQIKRTRWIGGVIIVISIATAVVMYLSMHDFYATTKL